eukprot:4707815-Prymnesium_polylepis.1
MSQPPPCAMTIANTTEPTAMTISSARRFWMRVWTLRTSLGRFESARMTKPGMMAAADMMLLSSCASCCSVAATVLSVKPAATRAMPRTPSSAPARARAWWPAHLRRHALGGQVVRRRHWPGRSKRANSMLARVK